MGGEWEEDKRRIRDTRKRVREKVGVQGRE